MFELHPQLAADCRPVADLRLCRLLLLNDARFPWFVLVPQRTAVSEIHQLSAEDQSLLIGESSRLAVAMEAILAPDKLNIAALGNMVPQLHVHHIARYRSDPAWPMPVWGHGSAQPYAEASAERLIARMRAALADLLVEGRG